MKKITTLALVSLLSFGCSAKESDSQTCQYTKASIKQSLAEQKSAKSQSANHYYLRESQDPDSDETVLTEYLVLNNGSTATLEHKFCDMYNLEISYLNSQAVDKNTIKDLTSQLNQWLVNAPVKLTFKKPFSEIVNSTLSESQKKLEQTFSISLPDDKLDANASVEYELGFSPVANSSLYSSMFNLYLGVGGE